MKNRHIFHDTSNPVFSVSAEGGYIRQIPYITKNNRSALLHVGNNPSKKDPSLPDSGLDNTAVRFAVR